MSGRATAGPSSQLSGATDFVITTVNIPDRLDAQEVHARAESERDSMSHGGGGLARFLWRLAVAILALTAAVFVWRFGAPIRGQFSSEAIAGRLSGSLGVPVSVANASFRFSPTPRLVVEDIRVQGQYTIGQASLQFSWANVTNALRGKGWDWGELRVAPVEFAPSEALALLHSQAALLRVLPDTVSTIRFESITFPDAPLLPGRYQVIATRTPQAGADRIALSQMGANGQMELALVPGNGRTVFRLQAAQWRAPFGPPIEWDKVTADGSFSPSSLRVEALGLNGFSGTIAGAVSASNAGQWVANGALRGSNIDLGAVQHEVMRRAGVGAQANGVTVMQGAADFSANLAGRGATLQDALGRLGATGKVRVRLAALNGISLGVVATEEWSPDGQRGSTRFSDLEALFTASPGTLSVRDISGRSGALQVRGEVAIARDLSINGFLRSEIVSGRGRPPTEVRVSGRLPAPEFGH